MRIGSAFSGIGGLDLAALSVWPDARILWHIEREPWCRDVLRARWPEARLLDDVRALPDDLEPVDVLVGGPPCFVKGTLILTMRGYVPIENVAVGDEVLTHLGRWRRVTERHEVRESETIEVRAGSWITTTEEHPFYSREQGRLWDNEARIYRRTLTPPSWVQAKDLKGKRVAAAVVPEVDDDHTPEFWRLVGLYLANGWRTTRWNRRTDCGRIYIAAPESKLAATMQIVELAGYHPCPSSERTCFRVEVSDKPLYAFLEQFGKYSHGKSLTVAALSLPAEKAKALLEGFFAGDGHMEQNRRTLTTVSRSLALGLSMLARRAYGVYAPVHRHVTERTTQIEGRTVNQRDWYRVSIATRSQAILDDLHAWRTVKSVKSSTRQKVYNIAVEEDESYVAEDFVVHNCQPISVAGKGAGKSDDRWLWPEFIALAERCGAKIVVAENPARLLKRPEWPGLVRALVAAGFVSIDWTCAWASEAGAPHLRERMFLVARRAAHPVPAGHQISWETTRRGAVRAGGLEFLQYAGPEPIGISAARRLITEKPWSTPCSRDHKGKGEEWRSRHASADGNGGGTTLAMAVRLPAPTPWATPVTINRKSARAITPSTNNGPPGLEQMAELAEGIVPKEMLPGAWPTRDASTEQVALGPEWVECLMGLPVGWTDPSVSTADVVERPWPAPRGAAQYEWEPPRLVPSKKAPGRRARIKALGNAVVPQQAILAIRRILGT